MIKMAVVYDLPDLTDFKNNALNRATTRALVDAAKVFSRDRLPQRFKEGAARRFGWPQRAVKYMRRKLRKWGHQRDMVWSGDMRDSVLNHHTIRGTQRSVRAIITLPIPGKSDLPDYASTRRKNLVTPKGKGGMSYRRQLQVTLPKEEAEVAAFAINRVRKLLAGPEYRIKYKRRQKATG